MLESRCDNGEVECCPFADDNNRMLVIKYVLPALQQTSADLESIQPMTTYFTSDGTIYETVKSTPTGLPISGLMAEAVLQRLESLDDTFVVIERDQVLEFK
ncbi:unnamed protein product [Schistocephalus solidus]|uniref:Conserved domain protein n=1 Tax=Schistocephalus solidus TaxID=70667 RepID=A0A183T4X7_SCHSO|nr:unnamed protein product [Schistocephalus solidus]